MSTNKKFDLFFALSKIRDLGVSHGYKVILLILASRWIKSINTEHKR
jgi:hypothetical protein